MSYAPRPTPELRHALFGPTPPMLTTIRLATMPFRESSIIEWRAVHVHTLAASPIAMLFAAWNHENLLVHVRSIDRAYDASAPSHAHGNAFDLNEHEHTPDFPQAMRDIARILGFWCGTHHFELTRL